MGISMQSGIAAGSIQEPSREPCYNHPTLHEELAGPGVRLPHAQS